MSASLLAYFFWVSMLFFANYSPVPEAAEEVRRQGAKYGYRMEGYLGDITSEPNDAGGCEVRLEFSDYSVDPPQRAVTVKARRSSALSQWEIIEVGEKLTP